MKKVIVFNYFLYRIIFSNRDLFLDSEESNSFTDYEDGFEDYTVCIPVQKFWWGADRAPIG